MKIAFVSQAIDRIVPPNQNSVGTCTLGAARKLARYADVLVYALKDGEKTPASENGVTFRLLTATLRDRLLFDAQNKHAKLFRPSHPDLYFFLVVS